MYRDTSQCIAHLLFIHLAAASSSSGGLAQNVVSANLCNVCCTAQGELRSKIDSEREHSSYKVMLLVSEAAGDRKQQKATSGVGNQHLTAARWHPYSSQMLQ